MSHNRRIAVFAHCLHDRHPRGVQRVARAVTEELLDLLPPNVEAYCLLNKIGRQVEMTYEACDLRTWLSCNPLVISEPKDSMSRVKHFARRAIDAFVPPVVRRVWGGVKHRAGRYVSYFPAAHRWRDRFRKLRRLMGVSIPRHLATHWMVLDEIDLVISFEPFDDIWNEPTHRSKTRFVGWFHDAIPRRINEGSYWNPDKFDSCTTNACHRAHRMVCVSRSTEADLLTFFPLAAGKTRVIHLGHDISRFARGATADAAAVEAVFRRHGVSRSVPYLLFLGALEPRKNIVNILRACELARRQNPQLEFQLVLAGDASCQPAMADVLRRARARLPVHLVSYLEDGDAAIFAAHAQALLYPSLWEGFGIPMLEGMTAGTLVVAADLSSMPEVAGPHAIYCDPYDDRDMAEKFVQCLTMDDLERSDRINAARQHSAQFTWRKTAKALAAVIDEELELAAEQGAGADSLDISPSRMCA